VIKDSLIIGICGGSGSGKTTIIHELMHLLKAHRPALLSMDNYYKDIHEQEVDELGKINFDLPTAIDSEKFCSDLKKLRHSESLHLKKYQFNIKDREEFIDIPHSKVILTEGIFLFNIPEAMEMIDVKIYVELDHQLQFERRLQRDVVERGYDEKAVRYQWQNHVMPAFKAFIEIHKKEADIIVGNDGDLSHLVDQVDRHVLSHPFISRFCYAVNQ